MKLSNKKYEIKTFSGIVNKIRWSGYAGWKVLFSLVSQLSIRQGWWIMAVIKLGEYTLNVVNIYAPIGDDHKFFHNLATDIL